MKSESQFYILFIKLQFPMIISEENNIRHYKMFFRTIVQVCLPTLQVCSFCVGFPLGSINCSLKVSL